MATVEKRLEGAGGRRTQGGAGRPEKRKEITRVRARGGGARERLRGPIAFNSTKLHRNWILIYHPREANVFKLAGGEITSPSATGLNKFPFC